MARMLVPMPDDGRPVEETTPVAPARDQTILYIDGLNFYYGALKGTPNKWLDLEAFGRRLLPKDDIVGIKYFTAKVIDRFPGDRTGERQQAYLRAVRTNPLVEIHLGHFRSDVKWRALADGRFGVEELFSPPFRPAWLIRRMWRDQVKRRTEPATSARVVIHEEKGSDVNLGVNLVFDAAAGTCKKAIVISNDADLEEAIRLARRAGAEVGIVNPQRAAANKRLKKVADFEIPLRHEILEKCQLPNLVRDAQGRQVHCPKQWL
jgi:uncharacterized LabA/DUF88 family protein